MSLGAVGRCRAGWGYGCPRYYVLALLTVTYALSIVDRFLLGILLPQIKEELVLNDSMLGPFERHRIRALLRSARCTDCGACRSLRPQVRHLCIASHIQSDDRRVRRRDSSCVSTPPLANASRNQAPGCS
jgi:hypothetical protein